MALSGFIKKGRRVSEWFGRHQKWYLQLGIAGFIIAGVHLGADRIDDGCFVVLNFIDGGLDDLVNRFFGLLKGFGLITLESARNMSLGFADLIDVEDREAAARWVAIALELWVDFLLGRAALGYREDPSLGSGLFDMLRELGRTMKALAHRTKELIDVEFIVLPLSLFIGLIASSYLVFVVSGETIDQILVSFLGSSDTIHTISEVMAVILAAMVTWSLGFRALTSALRFTEKRAQNARDNLVHRARGLTLVATVLPVCALGSLFGTPIGGLF